MIEGAPSLLGSKSIAASIKNTIGKSDLEDDYCMRIFFSVPINVTLNSIAIEQWSQIIIQTERYTKIKVIY